MSKRLTEGDLDQVESWIGSGPKTFDLLYSITRNGCNASVLHQKCDNQGPTLTVLYNMEGSVYGGYTGVSWQSPHNVLNQTDDAAFLYQLDISSSKIPKKFPSKSGQTAICSFVGHGPIFGSNTSVDLFTFSGDILKSSSGEYNMNGNMILYGKNYETGGTLPKEVNNGHMRVAELEVYAVKDGRRQKPDLPTPWRKTAKWGPKLLDSLKEEVKGIKPPAGLGVPHFNILLLGPLGSGKSSFCNLVASVFRGRISHQARVGGSTLTSTTTLFTPYDFGDKASLQLYDTSGIDETNTLDLLQCNNILEGNVPNFYEMTPKSLISNDDADFLSAMAHTE
ncbi:IFI44-like protein [Mya arenaria]|uniref:IFI44-like protein n=1 Tax=Mya arenaria TaxID=6604 RepID=A0ABY7DED3_MYAAR|nr:interferon-induced protein 44-like isoform X2 [Mya arenaria]WAQ94438.1 IFI44-like protein [Mya arenaria]